MNIILDCDDVLLDWVKRFRYFCMTERGLNPDEAGPGAWKMTDWLGVSDDAAVKLIQEFNASHHFAFLDEVEGAKEAIARLARSHTLHVLTACSTDEETVARRELNLSRVFGPVFQAVKCIDLGASKATHLREFEPSIWIEDNYKHAVAGVEAGHRTFLRRRPHNRSLEAASIPEITWFTAWSEVVAHIEGE